ncbi:MAG: GH116 family glycosyl-hydrolase [Thermoguttaceae bacterium]
MVRSRSKRSDLCRWTCLGLLGFISVVLGRPSANGQSPARGGPITAADRGQSATVDRHGSGITYQGSTGAELGMALGGLGTSTLEIGRSGAFQGLRVQNNWSGAVAPTPAASFLSVHAHTSSGRAAGRILQLAAPEGLTPVKGLIYTGRFPFVQIAYRDPALPCQVAMEAFSPFVPHDAASSSLPLVFFTFRVRNPTSESLTAAVAVSWVDDIAAGAQSGGASRLGRWNSVLPDCGPAVLMGMRGKELAGSEYLLSCLPADGVRYSAVSDWQPGRPQPSEGPKVGGPGVEPVTRWRCFLDRGTLPEESRSDEAAARASDHRPAAAVAGRVELRPGEEKDVRFALVWFFPNHRERTDEAGDIMTPYMRIFPDPRARTAGATAFLGHQYAARFPKGTRAVAEWAFPRRESLDRRSRAWRLLIEESSLPLHCRALMTEILYLLPRISWWLADGTFVLHESIDCPRIHPTLLDIYTAPVMAALFPELHARSLRTIAAAQRPNGEIPSTLGIVNIHRHEYRAFNPADASVFPIVTAWEILWGGDPKFAADMYPVVKRVLQWGARDLDADRDGVPDVHGVDHGWDTFPMYGAAGYITDQWIAGLLAGQTLARRFGDREFADWCVSAGRKASATAEKILWNGNYYDLFHEIPQGRKSNICFAEQFTDGTVPVGILGLGEVHPPDRVRRSLECIWRLNVRPCKFVCRTGSNADGTPADQTALKQEQGGASQSNAFAPVSTAPLAAAAIQNGMVDEGLALAEATAEVIVHRVRGPWSGQLFFDSRTGRCFYGLHYSDCLILWDVMYALLGVHVDALEHSLELAPPRIPVKMPLFGKLYTGQVEFSTAGGVALRMANFADRPSAFRTLTIRLPQPHATGTCCVESRQSVRPKPGPDGRTVLADVVIPAKGELRLRWK